MLNRYGFRYCCGYYLEDRLLLPPANDNTAHRKVATPLNMAVLLFLREPPREGLVPGVGYILEQALQMARYHGLLRSVPISEKLPAIMLSPQRPAAPASPLDLVPRRIMDEGLMKVSNPLASSLMIASKPARRFFQAIDDHMTVRELMLAAQVDAKEIYATLRSLLLARRIALYEPAANGKCVDSEQLLNIL
jgi:hypothetical protein